MTGNPPAGDPFESAGAALAWDVWIAEQLRQAQSREWWGAQAGGCAACALSGVCGCVINPHPQVTC